MASTEITIKDKVDHFKSELYQYNFCKKKLNEYELLVEEINVKINGVSSPSFKDVILENNRNPYTTNKFELMHQEEELIKIRNMWASRVKAIEDGLNSVSTSDKELLIDLCIRERNDPKRTTYFKKSEELAMSEKTLKRRIDAIIEEIVLKCENVL